MQKLLKSFSLFSFVLVVLFLATACQEDNPIFQEVPQEEDIRQSQIYPNVDVRLWPYFAAFEEAAAMRGWEVDLSSSNITGEIVEIDEEHVAGQCSYHSQGAKDVTIDLEFWNRSSNLFKEFIIFHELGHCYLGRGHREDAFGNGTCKSIMRSGLEDCRDNYRTNTRNLYLDELFNPDGV